MALYTLIRVPQTVMGIMAPHSLYLLLSLLAALVHWNMVLLSHFSHVQLCGTP